MGNFRELKAWEMAHRIVLSIYRETAGSPEGEGYGLVAPMRRAAVSIAGNIAEGCSRNRAPEMAQFIRIALGSCTELEYHIILSCEPKKNCRHAHRSYHRAASHAGRLASEASIGATR